MISIGWIDSQQCWKELIHDDYDGGLDWARIGSHLCWKESIHEYYKNWIDSHRCWEESIQIGYDDNVGGTVGLRRVVRIDSYRRWRESIHENCDDGMEGVAGVESAKLIYSVQIERILNMQQIASPRFASVFCAAA